MNGDESVTTESIPPGVDSNANIKRTESTSSVENVKPLMSLFSPPGKDEKNDSSYSASGFTALNQQQVHQESMVYANESTLKRENTTVNRNATAADSKSKDKDHATVPDNIMDYIHFRSVAPTDLPKCKDLVIESASGFKQQPSNLSPAAIKQKLQYRQHHAAQFFRCAVKLDQLKEATTSFSNTGTLIGLIMATRCSINPTGPTLEQSHDAMGRILIVHVFCISKAYQKKGIGQRMLSNYVESIKKMRLRYGIDKLVLRVNESRLMIWLVQKLKFSVQNYFPDQDVYQCELNLNLLGSEDSKRKGLPYWVVDSFAHLRAGTGQVIRGSGNPAAIVLVDQKRNGFDPCDHETVHWMKTVAMEFQHSETAFIWKKNQTKKATTGTSKNKNDDTASDRCYNILYYTKDGTEVALCGHATLAASSVVFQILATKYQSNQYQQNNNLYKYNLEFYTRDNVLLKTNLAKREKSSGCSSNASSGGSMLNPNKPVKISMDFPLVNVQSISDDDDRQSVYKMVRDGFNIPESDLSSSVVFMGLQQSTSSNEATDLLIELTTEAFLNLDGPIDYHALCQWGGYTRGIILCCLAPKDQSNKNSNNADTSSNGSAGTYGSMCSPTYLNTGSAGSSFDFLSRFFGPKVGIQEDPVTGSAHCLLAPYFSEKLEKAKLVGRQMSQRGGTVECSIFQKSCAIQLSPMNSEIPSTLSSGGGSEEESLFILSGVAVTTMRGQLNIS